MSHASHWSAADSFGVPQTCLECRQRFRRSAAVCCGVCGTLFWSAAGVGSLSLPPTTTASGVVPLPARIIPTSINISADVDSMLIVVVVVEINDVEYLEYRRSTAGVLLRHSAALSVSPRRSLPTLPWSRGSLDTAHLCVLPLNFLYQGPAILAPHKAHILYSMIVPWASLSAGRAAEYSPLGRLPLTGAVRCVVRCQLQPVIVVSLKQTEPTRSFVPQILDRSM
ncbi:unnamed protein product [Mycena citricolor]|uniref:Uncharacterized protein n=1 Tax=Mycena citricolor TaxID=2018698 RepID=A0AAD2H0G3_9AGAR|nr:unnamed protein product [Mycena citricolor]